MNRAHHSSHPDVPRMIARMSFGPRWAALAALTATLVVAAAAVLALAREHPRLVWDSFFEVKPGALYRSGQLDLGQLEAAIHRYRLRTIVNLCEGGVDFIPERDFCRRRRVRFVSLPMPGNGMGDARRFQDWLAVAGDPAARPLLVHCASGSYRTGAAIALYRLKYDGWLLPDVVAEMRRHGYRPDDGKGDLVSHVLSIWCEEVQVAGHTLAGPRT